MRSQRQRTFLLFFVLVVIPFCLDVLTKIWAQEYVSFKNFLHVIPGILSFVCSYNLGAAFSFGEGFQILFLLLFCVVFISVIVYLALHPNTPAAITAGLAFMCGGGLGNAFDRVFRGFVIDFIYLDFLHFPIFNVADIFLTIGFSIFCIAFIKERRVSKGARDV